MVRSPRLKLEAVAEKNKKVVVKFINDLPAMERLQSLLNYNRYQFLSSDPTHFKTSGEPFGTFPKTKTRGRCRKK